MIHKCDIYQPLVYFSLPIPQLRESSLGGLMESVAGSSEFNSAVWSESVIIHDHRPVCIFPLIQLKNGYV